MIKKKHITLSPLVNLLFGGAILTVGDVIAAHWIRGGESLLFPLVIVLYLTGMIFLIASYRSEDIAVASTILVMFNVIILTIVGMMFLGEAISLIKILGILLCFISLVLLEWGKQ